MGKLVLASKSPRRLELLRDTGVEPLVAAYDVDETITEPLTPERTVVTLAERKARAAAVILGEHACILSADTVVALGDEIFGKPRDDDDARRMLRALSGTAHRVLTGIAVTRAGILKSGCGCTYVYFKRLTNEQIDEYVATGEPADKAGAYGIQAGAGHFVERLEGDYDNVVGLPVGLCANLLLDAFGLDLYKDFTE